VKHSKLGLLIVSLFLPLQVMAKGVSHHTDPIESVILGVTLILFFAILGRYIARRIKQPSVLGELLIGIIIGNLFYYFGIQLFIILREGPLIFNIVGDILSGYTLTDAVHMSVPDQKAASLISQALRGPDGLELLKVAYVVDIFSRYGVIFLLFLVGLDSSVEELKHTGVESIKVALIGVIAPIVLGFIAVSITMPSLSIKSDLFVAATLCATSIGITARILTEMQKLRTREAKTILGAALLDDILGLIILAIVSSIVITGSVDVREVFKIIALAMLFFTTAMMIGPILLELSIKLFRNMNIWEAKLFISFLFVMVLAWVASIVDLATIIGAFAAGLIIHDGYFKNKEGQASISIKNMVSPLELILAPLFFTLIGIQVKLETFLDWTVIELATALIIVAIVGKLVSGLGASKQDNRWVVGIGMLPRGEVGLVFASIGRSLGVISDQLFSAIILMVIVTTLLAPPLMKLSFK
jgi:Kef-type K+ transport system membrane component KefB